MEMRDKKLSSVAAQALDTCSCQVSDLEDIEFNWESSQFNMDAVFRPSIDTLIPPTTFDDLSMEGSVEIPLCWTKKAPLPSTPESVRPTESSTLQKSCAFGGIIENIPHYVL